MALRERPLSIAMLALGGQGGGVLTKWLVSLAEANGHLAQSTYIAGVAQRTGSTVYCVEMLPQEQAGARTPVFSPQPIPGDVDLVIAGEMAETGRAIQRGFVTPNVTTLIASSHRVYSVTEKSALGDGIVDQSKVAKVAAQVSKNFVVFDMQEAADASGAVISAVLFGAIAGSGALPFERAAFEATIAASGKAVEANLKGFSAGFNGALRNAPYGQPSASDANHSPAAIPEGPNGRALADRVNLGFPVQVRDMALHGALRTLDYQDNDYASHYLDLLGDIFTADSAYGGEQRQYALTSEVARQLALQMCYEDTIRVAALKTRQHRFAEIREHVAAQTDQPVRVFEYFHPRIEEACDTMPNALGAYVAQSKSLQKLVSPLFRKGRTLCTSNLGGFLLLHSLAKLKRFRRGTYRFKRQREHTGRWLQLVREAMEQDYELALAIAHCVEIVKGYGETYERGLSRYQATVDAASALAVERQAEAVRQLHRAALADEKGRIFGDALLQLRSTQ